MFIAALNGAVSLLAAFTSVFLIDAHPDRALYMMLIAIWLRLPSLLKD